jgi:hypothetical protein
MSEEFRFESDSGQINVRFIEQPSSRDRHFYITVMVLEPDGDDWEPVKTMDPTRMIPSFREVTYSEAEGMRRIALEIYDAFGDLERQDLQFHIDRPEGTAPRAPDPYLVSAISAASGAAAQQMVSAVVASIKKILAKRKESDGEDWRDSRGYL